MAALDEVAEWAFRRLGKPHGCLKPFALATALGLQLAPVAKPGGRLVGCRVEYDYLSTESAQRACVMLACAKVLLRARGVADTNETATALAERLTSRSRARALALVRGAC